LAFQPVTLGGGQVGWAFLTRTQDRQESAFRAGAELRRDVDYFKSRIAGITSAGDLVADRRLLKVALGAFGLGDDLDKRAFIRKVLADGVEDPAAMANRLVDKRYAGLAEAFGFGSTFGARTGRIGFADQIADAYMTRAFEEAIGTEDNDLRLAMTFRREIAAIAAQHPDSDTGWLQVLGSPPLRAMVEGAFALPAQFVGLDLDRQVDILRDRTSALFGRSGVGVFAEAENVERMITRHLALSGSSTSILPGNAALSILSAGRGAGPSTIEAVFQSLY
jgi:hypothetical protein